METKKNQGAQSTSRASTPRTQRAQNKQNTQELVLPGMEIVGRGVKLRPYQPYELKSVLFKQDKKQPYYMVETDLTYSVPAGYAVNNSPPLPARAALNKVSIEESWDRFDKKMQLDANVAAGIGAFSIDAKASQNSELRSDEESYYATRSSFIPLWSTYLPNFDGLIPELNKANIPTPFSHKERRVYEQFFNKFGSHFVKRAWVGGKATLTFTVAKSSEMSKEDIKAGIKASFSGVGDANVEAGQQQSTEKLRNNSECTVFGSGGDEIKLAGLSSLDETVYNEWLSTIKENPQAIELEVAGIWTLIDDPEKAKALQDAYLAATSFIPITAVFNKEEYLYFIRGNKYSRYNLETKESEKFKLVAETWKELEYFKHKKIDAAFAGTGLVNQKGEDLTDKIFIFSGDEYVRFDFLTGKLDEGYPVKISEGWPGMPFEGIDAVLNDGPNALYFFRGKEYVRFDKEKNQVVEGYPKNISERWNGVTFDRIDAAISWGNGKVYFFSGDQHVRYDMVNYCSDPGYPKNIIGRYVEDWKFFD